MLPTPSTTPRIRPLTAIPAHLFPQLPPAAAKLYLILLARLDPADPLPRCTATLPQLAQISGLSERTCWHSLRQLSQLRLLRRAPRKYHVPTTYILQSPAAPTPATNSQPAATPPTPISQPVATYSPTISQPAASYSPAPTSRPPISTPKTQISQPAARLLTQPAAPLTMPYRGGELFPLSTLIAHIDDPNQASSLIQTIFPLLSPAQKEFLLADAQATVARLDAQEAAP